jgi:hypothetical protein
MILDFLRNRKLRTVGIELLLALGVIAGYFIVLHYINATEWKQVFLSNSDMLTLPLVNQSITLHEPFQWMFSSQLFIFPEAPLYAIASIFSDNYKSTLLLNGFINTILLYGLIRLLVSAFTKSTIYRRAFPFLYTIGILLLFLLENRHLDLFIGMFFLTTTAYYGVILSSITALALSAYLLTTIREQRQSTVRRNWLLGASFGIALLTTTSNPMFFLQFTAAFSVVVLSAWIIKAINWRSALYLALPYIVAIPVSMVIRKLFFIDYLSPLGGLTNYFNFDSIGLAVKQYVMTADMMLQGSLQRKTEIILLAVLVLIATLLSIYILFVRLRHKKGTFVDKLSDLDIIIILFSAVAPIATLSGTILTGNPLTRYLLPLIFFTPLFLIPLYRFVSKPAIGVLNALLVFISCGVIAIAAFLQPITTFKQLADYYPDDAACLDRSLSGTPHTAGVAQYWRARALQLSNNDGYIVAQVGNDIDPLDWLYNTASYELYDYSFVVIDKPKQTANHEISDDQTFIIKPAVVLSKLGQPSDIYQCETFDLYVYDRQNPGRNILNQLVRDTR